VIGFVAGAAAGEQEPRTVTVTSIVTSLVPASTTTTTEPEPTTTTIVRTTTTTRRPRPATTTTRRRLTTTTRAPTRNCHPSYPDFCIPPPPDLDCPEIGETDFTVQEPIRTASTPTTTGWRLSRSP
jgi:hypothetical protein